MGAPLNLPWHWNPCLPKPLELIEKLNINKVLKQKHTQSFVEQTNLFQNY